MLNAYPEAIDILFQLHSFEDYREMLVEIVKHNPEAIVEANRSLNRESWKAEVDRLLVNKKKIEAIKVWRTVTGLGLKEAKEAVEARQEEMGV